MKYSVSGIRFLYTHKVSWSQGMDGVRIACVSEDLVHGERDVLVQPQEAQREALRASGWRVLFGVGRDLCLLLVVGIRLLLLLVQQRLHRFAGIRGFVLVSAEIGSEPHHLVVVEVVIVVSVQVLVDVLNRRERSQQVRGEIAVRRIEGPSALAVEGSFSDADGR